MKYTVQRSEKNYKRCVEPTDTVNYMHCTRFDNGQLVDFDERRRVANKFEMADRKGHDYIRTAFLTMCKGDVVWLKIGEKHHKNIYHTYCKKEHLMTGHQLGPDIYLRLYITDIQRAPVFKDPKTFEGKVDYFETVREICKELVADSEDAPLANAQRLYQRCLGEFVNMPKKLKESLSEEQT